MLFMDKNEQNSTLLIMLENSKKLYSQSCKLDYEGFNQRNKVFIQAEWDVIQKMTCH